METAGKIPDGFQCGPGKRWDFKSCGEPESEKRGPKEEKILNDLDITRI